MIIKNQQDKCYSVSRFLILILKKNQMILLKQAERFFYTLKN